MQLIDPQRQRESLCGGEFCGGGACDCHDEGCGLCGANFGAGALDLDRVSQLDDYLHLLHTVVPIGSPLPEMARVPGLPDMAEAADPRPSLLEVIGDYRAREMHLYFAWNIDNPDVPCHRDMFGAGGAGCGIWRAILEITPPMELFPLGSGAAGSLGVRVLRLDPVWPSGATIDGALVANWFPSVRRVDDRVFLAHNAQWGSRKEENMAVWRELAADGLTPTSAAQLRYHARFPSWSNDAQQLALTLLGDRASGVDDDGQTQTYTEENVWLAALDPGTLGVVSEELISDTASMFKDAASDAAFVRVPFEQCLIYQGEENPAEDGSDLMFACDSAAGFQADVLSEPPGGRCGHPAPTGSGEWFTCSNNAIFAYPLRDRGDATLAAGEGRGGLFVDVSEHYRSGEFQFIDADGEDMICDSYLQTYSSWGDTEELIVFTVMCTVNDLQNDTRVVLKSTIFLASGSPADIPLEVEREQLVDIGDVITQYAVDSGLIRSSNAGKLSYCTADFYMADG